MGQTVRIVMVLENGMLLQLLMLRIIYASVLFGIGNSVQSVRKNVIIQRAVHQSKRSIQGMEESGLDMEQQ